ncbi:MAG: hypothetical protein IPK72_16995 [Candidatus Eisenbacteria bacterium]|nr:hypothetical protein [Candidatus Eisenbacteria bacterium]
MSAGDDPQAAGPGTGAPQGEAPPLRAADRVERELHRTLLHSLLELERGVLEFRRVYGIASDELPLPDPDDLARRLAHPVEAAQARMELDRILQDLKVHQIALLEGYTEATQVGSQRLIESLDPEKVRDQFDRGSVQVGPLKVSARFRPVLIQAIWEEILRRCQQYRALDPVQFERFYREGFQRGYRRFWEARRGRGAGN